MWRVMLGKVQYGELQPNRGRQPRHGDKQQHVGDCHALPVAGDIAIERAGEERQVQGLIDAKLRHSAVLAGNAASAA